MRKYEEIVEGETEHDRVIRIAVEVALNLGYEVVECSLGVKAGRDCIVRNPKTEEKIVIESELGHGIATKEIKRKFGAEEELLRKGEIKGIIVVYDSPRLVKMIERNTGLRPRQDFFFIKPIGLDKILPALLVRLLPDRYQSDE